MGVDGSEEMIRKARSRGDGEFHHIRLPGWKPPRKYDLVHSMEFLYYLDDPISMLSEVHDHWVAPGVHPGSRGRPLPRERGQLGLAHGAQRPHDDFERGSVEAGNGGCRLRERRDAQGGPEGWLRRDSGHDRHEATALIIPRWRTRSCDLWACGPLCPCSSAPPLPSRPRLSGCPLGGSTSSTSRASLARTP